MVPNRDVDSQNMEDPMAREEKLITYLHTAQQAAEDRCHKSSLSLAHDFTWTPQACQLQLAGGFCEVGEKRNTILLLPFQMTDFSFHALLGSGKDQSTISVPSHKIHERENPRNHMSKPAA
jgi:hypothetical protein